MKALSSIFSAMAAILIVLGGICYSLAGTPGEGPGPMLLGLGVASALMAIFTGRSP